MVNTTPDQRAASCAADLETGAAIVAACHAAGTIGPGAAAEEWIVQDIGRAFRATTAPSARRALDTLAPHVAEAVLYTAAYAVTGWLDRMPAADPRVAVAWRAAVLGTAAAAAALPASEAVNVFQATHLGGPERTWADVVRAAIRAVAAVVLADVDEEER